MSGNVESLFKRLLRALLLFIPEPIIMVILIGLSGYVAVIAASRYALRNTKKYRTVDVVFVSCYTAASLLTTVGALIMFGMIADRLPLVAVFGVAVSILGVWASVAVNAVLSVAQSEQVTEHERSFAAVTRRLLFLHCVVGVAVAFVTLLIPSTCPFSSNADALQQQQQQ